MTNTQISIGRLLDVKEVRHLELAPEQSDFVGPIAEMVQEIDPQIDFHVIRAGDDVVGFFKIDRGMDRNDFARPAELGLRGLLVGAQYQGLGYGSAAFAALPGYLARMYDSESVVLTVNCRNTLAHHVYVRAGWIDKGELYLGGRAGPQHVLRLALR